MHAGKHDDSFSFLERAMTLEIEKLGGRQERLVELYDLAASIYDDVSKGVPDFIKLGLVGMWYADCNKWDKSDCQVT